MNTYKINDDVFKNSYLYQEFMKKNPTIGYLRIRAFSAKEAIPIPGLKIMVSTNYENNTIVFYEGETNESGIIDRIALPTPRLVTDNMDVPSNIQYEVKVINEDLITSYEVKMYEGICTVQNINVVPSTLKVGAFMWP